MKNVVLKEREVVVLMNTILDTIRIVDKDLTNPEDDIEFLTSYKEELTRIYSQLKEQTNLNESSVIS